MEIALLKEDKKIVELNQSHEVIKKDIESELLAAEYNSIVTMENFKEMKESSGKLGKTSKFISDFRIAKKKSEMGEINLFNDNLVSYCKAIDKKQGEIKSGLSVFEEETKKQVVAICKAYLQDCYSGFEIREEFQNINVDDMSQTGYMTPKGAITSKGKAEVESRINLKLSQQTKIDNRLMQLENQCLKEGIEPLSSEHIQGFLYEDDAKYNSMLNSLISAEKSRMEKIKENERLKAEKEAAKKHLEDRKTFLNETYLPLNENITTEDIIKINYKIQNEPLESTKEIRNNLKLAEMRIEDMQRELEPVEVVDSEKEIIKEVPEEHLPSTPALEKTLSSDENIEVTKKINVSFDLVLPFSFLNKNQQIKKIYEKRFIEQLRGDFKNLVVSIEDE